LCNILGGSVITFPSTWGHFEGLGSMSTIPSYFRAQGRVRNLMLSRSQAKLIVKSVWEVKVEEDKLRSVQHLPPITLSGALDIFLGKHLPSHNLIVETAYSLVDVLRSCSNDLDSTGWTAGKVFLMILEGNLPDEVRCLEFNIYPYF
jgi:hypothetical protein